MKMLCFTPMLLLLALPLAHCLHTSGRWIVDDSGQRVKLRCANWPAHMELRIPEGLQHREVDLITKWIFRAGFNCIRLNYSVDMALEFDEMVSESFERLPKDTPVHRKEARALWKHLQKHNSWIGTATSISTLDKVVSSLHQHGINVILDNTVSKASWCCNSTDGNGWVASQDAAVASRFKDNSQYWDYQNWLASLKAMGEWSMSYPNVIGMSIRNEMRPDINNGEVQPNLTWYDVVTDGARTIHGANSNLLVMIGSLSYDLDFSFLQDRPLDTSDWKDRTVWEAHSYSWSFTEPTCDHLQRRWDKSYAFITKPGQLYTGPLWISEFGVPFVPGKASSATQGLSQSDHIWLKCFVRYMECNDLDWGVWGLQGDYLIRDGHTNFDEAFGMLNQDWKDWRNPHFVGLLGEMWNMRLG